MVVCRGMCGICRRKTWEYRQCLEVCVPCMQGNPSSVLYFLWYVVRVHTIFHIYIHIKVTDYGNYRYTYITMYLSVIYGP